jgi:hypothetical protein
MKTLIKSSAKILAAFIILFIAHLVASFTAWAFAPGNVVPRTANVYSLAQRIAWPVFSFPVFYVVPPTISTTSFETLLVVNSAVVASVGVILVLRYRKRVVRIAG